MDVTAVRVREIVFGARDLTTQDIVDHFGGSVELAEAYLRGQIDWAGQVIVRGR